MGHSRYECFRGHDPAGFHKSHRLKEIEVNYLAEALYGDQVSVYSEVALCEGVSDHTFLHSLRRDRDGAADRETAARIAAAMQLADD